MQDEPMPVLQDEDGSSEEAEEDELMELDTVRAPRARYLLLVFLRCHIGPAFFSVWAPHASIAQSCVFQLGHVLTLVLCI